MPKKEEENSLGLNDSLVPVWESLVQTAENEQLSTRTELENVYNQIWERTDTNLARAIQKMGKDNMDAQESVINHVKSFLTKIRNTPVYDIEYRRISYQESILEEKDDDGNYIKGTGFSATYTMGIGVLINTKTGVRFTPRFVSIRAYRENAKKLKAIEDNEFTIIQASGKKNPGDDKFISMRVDDRSNEATTSDKDLDIPTRDEFIQNDFDITKVSQVRDRLSEGREDWRLVEGWITWGPIFKPGTKYASFEITDTAISLDETKEKSSDANVQVFADKNLVLQVGAGKDSKVQVLGTVRKSTNEKYNNISMWYPKMIIPIFKVDIEDYAKPVSAKGDDSTADSTDTYLEERMATVDKKEVVELDKIDDKEMTELTDSIKEQVEEVAMEAVPEITKLEVETKRDIISREDGTAQCVAFGEYNDTDDDCKACKSDPKFRELAEDCEEYSK